MLKLTRAERMRRHHKRRSRGGLNLVSLMDIFTILVFFLLVNSGDVDVLPGSRDVTLPESTAEAQARETLTVTVTHDDILVQGRRVAGTADAAGGGATVPGLVEALRRHAARDRVSGDAAPTDREVTILGDRELPYSLLRRVMASCTEADFTHVSLAVDRRAGDPRLAQADGG